MSASPPSLSPSSACHAGYLRWKGGEKRNRLLANSYSDWLQRWLFQSEVIFFSSNLSYITYSPIQMVTSPTPRENDLESYLSCLHLYVLNSYVRARCKLLGVEHSTKFYTGRLRPEVQTLTLLYSIFDRKGTPFVYFPRKTVPLSYTYGVVSYAAVLSVVTQRSSPLTAASIRHFVGRSVA